MSLVVFGVVFWICAIAFMAIRANSETKNILTTIIKMAPAISSAVFVLLTGSTLFYLLLAVALVFCGLGDVGMEINILPGLGLFLISHFIYTSNFIYHGLAATSILAISGFAICLAMLMAYLFFYFRYIKTSEQGIPSELVSAAYFYGIMISLTASSSLLLWLTTGALYGFIPFVGILLFIASDSMILIKEFHHKFKYDETLTLGTYYLAIFLLAMSAIIFII